MSDETKNNEGPTCACGRVDIYKESLKLKKTTKDKDDDSTGSCQKGDDESFTEDVIREDQKLTKNWNKK